MKTSPVPETLEFSAFWNLIGSVLPLCVGLVAIPIILDGLGVERFGLLTLAWLIVGYFSLFDMGLGRALTKIIAEYRGSSREQEVPQLFWTSMLMMLLLGAFGAAVMWHFSESLTDSISVSQEYKNEAVAVVHWLAICLPVIVVSAGLRGVLEAYQQFRMINIIKVPFGVSNYLVPIAILSFHDSLSAVVVGAVISRVALFFVYSIAVGKVVPTLNLSPLFDRDVAAELLRFGGWMTITNIVGPLMVYMDSFVIGAVLTVSVVAYYTVPYEITTKLWILPGSIIAALFPLLAEKLNSDVFSARDIFLRASGFLFILMYPLALFLVCFSLEGMEYWLGEEFAAKSGLILKILFSGVFINSIAMFPFALLQSAGHPRATAKIHLLELPFYLLLLLFLLSEFGVLGAAFAWLIRVSIDSLLMCVTAGRLLPEFSHGLKKLLYAQTLALLSFGVVIVLPWAAMKAIICVVVFCVSLLWVAIIIRKRAKQSGNVSLSAIRKQLFEA